MGLDQSGPYPRVHASSLTEGWCWISTDPTRHNGWLYVFSGEWKERLATAL